MAHVKNMTEGKPFPIIFSFFIPILCSTLFQQMYNMVDAVVVGKGIDDMALAAVGATGAITFFIFGFIGGLSSGMSVLMAQSYGAGNYERLRKSITMGIVSCGGIGILIMVGSLVAVRPVLELLQTSEEIMDDAVLYIVIILAGIPLTLAYNCLGGILRALGDSKTPLVAVIISSFVNIALDIIFVVAINMGVAGAAIATLIAQLVSGIFCFWKIKDISCVKLKMSDWSIDINNIWQQIKIGVPLAFMNSVTAVGSLLLQYFVNKLGKEYTAAYSACAKVTQLMMQPCTAVGVTMNTYAGQNIGAKKIDRIYQGIKSAGYISLTLFLITGAALLLIPEVLASIMLSEPHIIALTPEYLRVCGCMMWSIAFLFLTRSTLQGMGFTVIPMVSGFLELAARVVVVLALWDELGFVSIAVAEVSAWTAALLLNGGYLAIKMKSLKKQYKTEG